MVSWSLEIAAVAKAKGITEDEVWRMTQSEYYQCISVLEAYNREIAFQRDQEETMNSLKG